MTTTSTSGRMPQLAPVPSAGDLLHGVADRLELSLEQVERTLAEANLTVASPAAADRRLRVLRLRAQGVKHSGAAFTIEQAFSPGVWAIVHPDNSAGKTSLLELLVWPLRGEPRDLPPDVRSWLRYLSLDVAVAGRPVRIVLDLDPDTSPRTRTSVRARILTADTIEELLTTDDDGMLRLLAQAAGAAEVNRCIGRFMLDTLRMGMTSVWQATGGADGEGAPQLHGWAAYFGACYLNPGGDEILLGDVSAAGLPARLLELFVDIPYSTALTQLSVATKREQKVRAQARRRAEGDAEARRSQRTQWEQQLAQVTAEIVAVQAAADQETSLVLQAADQTAEQLRRQRAELREVEQTLAETRARRVRAQQSLLDARESWQARRVLGRLDPVCCPRCEEPLGTGRHETERHDASCAVCTRPLPPVDNQTAQAILRGLEQDQETAGQAEEHAVALRAMAAAAADAAHTAHQEAAAALEQALATSQAHRRLRDLELQAAGLQGRLEATGTPTQEPPPPLSAQVVEAVKDAVQTTVAASAKQLFPAMNAQIVQLAARFGVQNLDSVSLNRAGQVNAVKAGVPTNFKDLSRGDRLRMRIATVIALLRVGADRGVAAHPGLLLIDSVAAEEVAQVPARTLIAELQTVASELPDLQVVLTTAQPELLEDLHPDRLISSDEEHLF
ncbi:hypothetical protein ACLQ2P_07170 [Actinomadura citrea]|uniref:hypothetical protein n=1 Tax=Actinomadura citrea TaxID=46158 RepID=UPI003CE4C5F0